MRKFDLKYLYSAGAAAALTAAAIAIPAWGDSGGGQGDQAKSQRAPAPMLPPPAGAAFFERGRHAAPDRKHLDELTDCMRDKGIDVPDAPAKGGGFSIQLPPPAARTEMEKAAKECGLPAPPPRGQLGPLTAKQREQAQKAMKGLSQCMRKQGEDVPVPVPPPRGK